MGIADELKKLHDLHARGGLTDDEYARAKEAVLAGPLPLALDADDPELPPLTGRPGDEAPRFASFRLVATVATLLLFVIVFFSVFLPRLEKGWENLTRFREQSQQRKQIQGLRDKAPTSPGPAPAPGPAN